MTDPLRPKTIFELLTFKMDRTLAVAGVVIMGAMAILFLKAESTAIVTACVGALAAVLGARINK